MVHHTENQNTADGLHAEKPVIYQLLPRLFANYCQNPVPNGTIEQNGSGKLNAITPLILKHIRDLGATHVWYTGVIEHAHDADYTAYGIPRHNPNIVKGKAGSPYAITDYYDIDPDLAEDVPARMAEFDALVERTHAAGMRVIIDFVPNHVARQYHSDVQPAGVEQLGAGDNTDMFFSPANNFYYIPRQRFSPSVDLGSGPDAYVEFPAKATGNDCFTAFPGVNDWYETVKLNYGVDPSNGSHHFDPIPPTWYKMLHILRFWASRGIDGFRCDMAHMVPVEFWRWAIANVRSSYPHVVFIAEIYDVNLYRPYIDAGFDYLYDKVNLYDTLRGIECSGLSAAQLTSCWQRVDGIGRHMLNFLENHDEQRFASVQYAGDARRVLPSLVVSAMLNTGPMMIYAGQELGEPGADAEGYSGYDGRTTIFDYWSLASLRQWLDHGSCQGKLSAGTAALRRTYAKVLGLCNSEAAVSRGLFFDLMYVNYQNPAFDPHRHFAFLRAYKGTVLLIVVNFGDNDADISVNLPVHAFDTLGMMSGPRPASELLGGRTATLEISSVHPVTIPVKAHGAAVWKFAATPRPAASKAGGDAPAAKNRPEAKKAASKRTPKKQK